MEYDVQLTPGEVLSRIAASRQPRPDLETPFASAHPGTETTLANCWSEVLRFEEVGRHDNFFSLGGDSLQITQIASRLRQRHGIELPFNAFFEHPTIAELALVVDGAIGPGGNGASGIDQENGTTLFEVKFDLDRQPRLPLLARLREEGDRPNIRSIVVPTRERPSALRRCLIALIRNLQEYGHTPRVLVADGSRDPKNTQENEAVVRHIAGIYGGEIQLFGPVEREKLVDRMTRDGLDREIVDFAFGGAEHLGLGSIGAVRNLLLLAAAGEAFLSLDDDTECRFVASPHFKTGVQCGGRAGFNDDPAEIWTKPDRPALFAAAAFADVDFVMSHQELLGRTTARLAAALKPAAQLSAEDFDRLVRQPGTVRITLNGLIGDCGWGTPSRYLFIEGSSFARLVDSEQSYRSGTTSREMLRIAPSFAISREADSLMSTAFGADGRALLPPFVPVGRGSDAVFGRMLRQIMSDTVFGHLPWGILHQPLENRRFWPGEILRSASSTDLRGMFCDMLPAVPRKEIGPESDAVRDLGRGLVGIAAQDIASFRSEILQLRRSSVAKEIAFLEGRIQTIDRGYSVIQQDLRAYVQALKNSLDHPAAGIPAELLYGHDVEQAVPIARQLTALYGRLLCAWPDIAALKQSVFEP